MIATALPQTQDLKSPNLKVAGAHEGEASTPAQATARHDEFYFTDDMIVFQVKNRLFRVHQHFLAENSLVFGSMFSLPRTTATTTGGSTADAEGTSDANPIYLADVTELEFETLLRYFYKGMHDGFKLPQPSWIALLSIAHRYEFLNVYERAIREIYDPAAQQAQDHMLLIIVAEMYDVPPKHLIPSLVTFVMRAQPLSEGEVARFSALTVSRLAHAREDFVRRSVNAPPPLMFGLSPPNSSGPSWKEKVAKDVVRKIWQIPTDVTAHILIGPSSNPLP
ncbi:hypothetical protein V8E53_005318 [Lactarius tabidus]